MGGDWKEMFNAASEGDIELVKYHLKMGVDLNYQHPEYMTSVLIECIRLGKIEMVKFLLKNGADPSATEGFGTTTTLSIAKSEKNHEAVHLLISYLKKGKYPIPKIRINKIVVTGGNRGIGKAIAQKLLEESQEVVIVCRNEEVGKSVVEELKSKTGNSKISMIQGDLSSIQKCKTLIEKIKIEHPDINILINNAGIWMSEMQLNEDKLEMSFMVNYLAPYLLCDGLFPILKNNQPARIVNVNAGLYVKGKLDVEKTPYGLDFGSIKTYMNTKFCNVMSTIDFSKRIEGSGVTINVVHPGVIKTGLGDSPKFLSKVVKFFKRFWKSPEYGAGAPTWLALSEELDGVNGNYYNEKKIMEYIDEVKNENSREALRIKTEEILNK
ncbi:MAG: SDR family NAD(P)-dependent oxidoreductase [Saprospiraceae bacterium]